MEDSLKEINTTVAEMVNNLSQLIFQEKNRTKQANFDELRLQF